MMEKYVLVGHTPIRCDNILEFCLFFSNGYNRRVEFTQINEDIVVNTVFLGLDHQWGNGPPLLFETMVFGGELDQNTDRYSTWEEAIEGHKNMCILVQYSIANPPTER